MKKILSILFTTSILMFAACGDDDGGGPGDGDGDGDGDNTKDAYNSASNRDTWTNFTGDIATSLAILDSLADSGDDDDDEQCGDSFGFDADGLDAGTAYQGIAGALADDRLLVDTSTLDCGEYLAVEAGVPLCGGRTPNDDVGNRSYSVLTNGSLADVSDGVDADDCAGHSNSEFPFLARPSGENTLLGQVAAADPDL